MRNLPDAVFVIDTRKEAIAVAEARKLKIPVIGIVDTNCDPDEVDYVIPARRRAAGDPALRRPHRRRHHRRPRPARVQGGRDRRGVRRQGGAGSGAAPRQGARGRASGARPRAGGRPTA